MAFPHFDLNSEAPNQPKRSSRQVQEIHDAAEGLLLRSAAVVVFNAVLECEAGRAWLGLLEMLRDRPREATQPIAAYSRWVRSLASATQFWPDLLIDRILDADNAFSQAVQTKDLAALNPSLVDVVQQDLRHLQAIYGCESEKLRTWVLALAPQTISLVSWPISEKPRETQAQPETETQTETQITTETDRETDRDTHTATAIEAEIETKEIETKADRETGKDSAQKAELKALLQRSIDWSAQLADLAAYYRAIGVGALAKGRAFRWHHGDLVAVASPDPIALADLAGYERPKAQLIENTEFLLAGQRALNVLLYGARGTGKSSLVKALLSAYGDRGLRLVEVAKRDLHALPEIVDRLRSAPQKVIIFVDDLSFEEDDDEFKALKVVLEGGLTERPKNVVVYATSNRRHLVREYFADRPDPKDADEVQAWDTVQEKLSFADRFGLALTFELTDQPTYLAIVRHLAAQAALTIDPGALDYQALQWATQHNGRSGRTARQFIDVLVARQAIATPAPDHSAS